MLKTSDNSFDYCIKCNACVVNCPVASNSLDFAGPKHLGPELKRLIKNQRYIDDARLEYCTLCGNCDIACPEGVELTALLIEGKALHDKQAGTMLRDKLLSQAELIGKAASTLAPLTNLTMNFNPARRIMQAVLGIHAERKFPKYKYSNFNRRYKKKIATTKRKVAYFVGCYAIYNAPEVGDAFIEVMDYNGIEVAVPKQHCCGIPMLANGQKEHAFRNASYNVKSLLAYTRQGYDVVLTCTSCSLALKKDYVEVLKIAGSEELAKQVYDAGEYLRMLKEDGELNSSFSLSSYAVNAGYFAPCHMKAQGIGNPTLDILELIPGVQIQDLASSCCGQSGTFGFKKEKFALSLQIGSDMQQAVNKHSSDYTVTECGMCKNQLEQLTAKPVLHPMQVLALAYNSR